jgi:hypothetical protein
VYLLATSIHGGGANITIIHLCQKGRHLISNQFLLFAWHQERSNTNIIQLRKKNQLFTSTRILKNHTIGPW